MNTTLFASELMFLTIALIAIAIFWDLWRTKDGSLRIIMLCYMASEFIVYTGSALYFWLIYNSYTHLSIENFRLIILPAKVASMLALMIWVRRNDGL